VDAPLTSSLWGVELAQQTNLEIVSGVPWYREVTREQWRAFFATFLGWAIDAFDFTMLTFILIDIQKSFTVDRALAGALVTVTLLMRLLGGIVAGSAADRFGRKLPLIASILWFSLFAFLSGFSRSYAMLFPCALSSASGWVANGRQARRLLSNTGPNAIAAWHQECCKVDGSGATWQRPRRFNSSIRCSKTKRISDGA